jgi:hypothetical protein
MRLAPKKKTTMTKTRRISPIPKLMGFQSFPVKKKIPAEARRAGSPAGINKMARGALVEKASDQYTHQNRDFSRTLAMV